MDIEKYKAVNDLTNADVISIIQPEFPKFGRPQLSMCSRGVYGVVLAPKAVKALNKVHPIKKENRKKGNKLTVRLTDTEYKIFMGTVKSKGMTAQKAIETAIEFWLDIFGERKLS